MINNKTYGIFKDGEMIEEIIYSNEDKPDQEGPQLEEGEKQQE